MPAPRGAGDLSLVAANCSGQVIPPRRIARLNSVKLRVCGVTGSAAVAASAASRKLIKQGPLSGCHIARHRHKTEMLEIRRVGQQFQQRRVSLHLRRIVKPQPIVHARRQRIPIGEDIGIDISQVGGSSAIGVSAGRIRTYM